MKRVTVAGCGIIGLTTAIALQEKGWKVKIVAREKFNQSLSHKVGAIWFPFEVHPIEPAIRWASRAFTRYKHERIKGNGVSFIPFTVVFDDHSDTSWTNQLPTEAVRRATTEELPEGVEKAYVATVPLAEPPLYLPHLFDRFITNGGEFQFMEIAGIDQLCSVDTMVVNCLGLGAKEVCNDNEMTAMRGQILRTQWMDISSCVNSTKAGALSYIIKRSNDCIIGGTDYLNDWNEKIDAHDTALILQRFRNTGLYKTEPVILEELVGLRPRRTSVRFEFDQKFDNLFHNYGHGGAGFTVGWGCALELAEILD